MYLHDEKDDVMRSGMIMRFDFGITGICIMLNSTDIVYAVTNSRLEQKCELKTNEKCCWQRVHYFNKLCHASLL